MEPNKNVKNLGKVKLNLNEFLTLYCGVILGENFTSCAAKPMSRIMGSSLDATSVITYAEYFNIYINKFRCDLAKMVRQIGRFRKNDKEDIMKQIDDYVNKFYQVNGKNYVIIDAAEFINNLTWIKKKHEEEYADTSNDVKDNQRNTNAKDDIQKDSLLPNLSNKKSKKVKLNLNEFLTLYTGFILGSSFDVAKDAAEKLQGKKVNNIDVVYVSNQFQDYINTCRKDLAKKVMKIGPFIKNSKEDILDQTNYYIAQFARVYKKDYVKIDVGKYAKSIPDKPLTRENIVHENSAVTFSTPIAIKDFLTLYFGYLTNRNYKKICKTIDSIVFLRNKKSIDIRVVKRFLYVFPGYIKEYRPDLYEVIQKVGNYEQFTYKSIRRQFNKYIKEFKKIYKEDFVELTKEEFK